LDKGGVGMNLYRKVCYKVEDAFIKLLTKKQETTAVVERVSHYRLEREKIRLATNKKGREIS
jgi:hypothetical protein